ncbi:hypothetical protein OJF2_54080 [Aquisphaera giovannonii]|uniref:Permease n=1 Tax=Aquisphaera giovannonii TaxID=406548 RepID=A0A5B9W8C3_9BACT|nr:permease [Aquisphaera giovannonii]QEH36823.1 hypothetical protein OJF2_54080 [Aquisphaera giovannonii]
MSSVPEAEAGASPRRGWSRGGDLNAFFGLMIDNIGGMILMTSLLVGFGMPRDFVLSRMIPGTAVGVLVGDLIYTAMAWRMARKTGRTDVTAMPLGLDTPSTFGSVILIIGPSYNAALGRGLDPSAAAEHAWFIGLSMLLASGIFKLACAAVSGWVRGAVPRAGLLGSLAAIALVIISFLPLRDITAHPVAGLVSMAIILATLTARWKLPGQIPGALAAVVAGCAVYYGMHVAGLGPGPGEGGPAPSSLLRVALPMPHDAWWAWIGHAWPEVVGYLPVAIPLALATVVGGIDCTESAAAAGDDYHTGSVIAVEGFATVVAGLFGGVIQTTPYIGHPAYKAMGARSGYTLATALFVGAAGIFGYFDWIFFLLPRTVVFPILVFIGLEITAQSFHATTYRHYPAVGLACVPALGYLAMITINNLLSDMGKPFGELRAETQGWIATVTMLSGGFIVTSLLWGTFLAHLIDAKVRPAVVTLVLAAVCAWFGVIHSPLPSGEINMPGAVLDKLQAAGRAAASAQQTPYHWAAAYLAMAATVWLLGKFGQPPTAAEQGEEPIAI